MRRAGIIVMIAATLSLSCCGGEKSPGGDESRASGSASPSPEVTPDSSYGTLASLRDAAVETGYDCKNWKQDNAVALAAESGNCSDADVFSTYASRGDLQRQLDREKDMNQLLKDSHITVDPSLVGPNWIIKGPKVPAIAPQLGGTLVGAK